MNFMVKGPNPLHEVCGKCPLSLHEVYGKGPLLRHELYVKGPLSSHEVYGEELFRRFRRVGHVLLAIMFI